MTGEPMGATGGFPAGLSIPNGGKTPYRNGTVSPWDYGQLGEVRKKVN